MPLWLLAIIVAVGLAAIWLALRFLGFNRELVLADDDQVRAEWAADNPGAEAREVIRAESGKAALVRARGDWGLVWVMGLDTASHGLADAAHDDTGNGLVFRFGDFATPAVRVALTRTETALWRKMLEAG